MSEAPPSVTVELEPIKITEDGEVSKTVLQPGKGPLPSKHARCLVHYVGTIRSTGAVFMDTRKEGEPVTVVAGRDSVLQGAGLNLAVATMKTGEIASITVDPKYGYGTRGSFSFPSVPPHSELQYVVELLGFEEVDETKSSSSMLFEDRVEAAERRRLEGNRLYQAGSTTDALGKYAMALSYMDQDFMFQLQGPHEEKANAVRLPTLLNMAACHLEMEDFQGAIDAANQVLAVDKGNAKAYFRRGKARRLCGQTETALTDLTAALKLSPANSAVQKEIQMLKKGVREDQQAAAQIFKGRFPRPNPATRVQQQPFWSRLWQKIEVWIRKLFGWQHHRAHSA